MLIPVGLHDESKEFYLLEKRDSRAGQRAILLVRLVPTKGADKDREQKSEGAFWIGSSCKERRRPPCSQGMKIDYQKGRRLCNDARKRWDRSGAIQTPEKRKVKRLTLARSPSGR